MNLNSVSARNYNVGFLNQKNNTERINYNNELKSDTVSFTSKKKPEIVQPKKKSSFVHKALIASTNCLIPGLGQAINGQWGKALFFFAGAPTVVTASFLLTGSPLLATAVTLATEACMFIDAYKNA